MNNAISEANEFRENIHTEMDGYFGEKSEKWQDSDNGSAYQSWMDQWSEELQEIEIDEPDELEMPDTSDLLSDEGYPREP